MVVAPPPHFTLTIVLTRSTSYSSRPHFTTIYSEKYSAAEAEVSTILKFDPAMHYRVHTLYILYILLIPAACSSAPGGVDYLPTYGALLKLKPDIHSPVQISFVLNLMILHSRKEGGKNNNNLSP